MADDNSRPLLIRCDGDLLIATLNRPARANALDGRLLGALLELFSKSAVDPRCSVVILTGTGQHFCAGADVKAYPSEREAMSLRVGFNPVVEAMALLEKPVIAAVNGTAAGGGLGLLLAADIRVLGASARLVPSWINLGLVPDLGASWLLPRLMGSSAFSWLTSGAAMSAQDALRFGLATEVVADNEVVGHSLSCARGLARKPPLAVALTKRLLREAWGRDFAQQLQAEAALQDVANQGLTSSTKTDYD